MGDRWTPKSPFSTAMEKRVRDVLERTISRSSRDTSESSRANLRSFEGQVSHYLLDPGEEIVGQDDDLAPVILGIDAVQQLIENESRGRRRHKQTKSEMSSTDRSSVIQNLDPATDFPSCSSRPEETRTKSMKSSSSSSTIGTNPSREPKTEIIVLDTDINDQGREEYNPDIKSLPNENVSKNSEVVEETEPDILSIEEEDDPFLTVRRNPIHQFMNETNTKKQDDYEFVPKSSILDVYSNDPEVKRFLKQLTRIANEFGYDEQSYKCNSCRRPIGMIFGQSRLCHFDGHHYCSECHLNEKSIIPARVLCNWDFNKYAISKRNQHFLSLISNEPMFELKTLAPLLYETFPELQELDGLRQQAFFIRSYCFTCVQDSISHELTKLVWPREHLIKQVDLYSLEDLIQVKSGALKNVLQNVVNFGRQHVLNCMLCCLKGFYCEICKSPQIIYPFDTESVYRCDDCQSIYHNSCFESRPKTDPCPRCKRVKARDSH